jgi:hypothetical protein
VNSTTGEEFLLIDGTLFKVEADKNSFFSIDQPLVQYKIPVDGLGIEFYSDNEDSDSDSDSDEEETGHLKVQTTESFGEKKKIVDNFVAQSSSDESIDLMDSDFDEFSENDAVVSRKPKTKPDEPLSKLRVDRKITNTGESIRDRSLVSPRNVSKRESLDYRSLSVSKSVSPMKNRKSMHQPIADKNQSLGKKLFNTLLEERSRLSNLKKELNIQVKMNQEISNLYKDEQTKNQQLNQNYENAKRELEMLRLENQALKQKTELIQNLHAVQIDSSPKRFASPLKQEKFLQVIDSTRTPENSPLRLYQHIPESNNMRSIIYDNNNRS